ncbi:hypothetical protein SDC9_186681 [bioreactor metagenome]|uniref:Uncharacterized protein n=1 Tax=bioreactor metagenome TaxID=1076179 RepID=A0A645HUV4_9ZZZZ
MPRVACIAVLAAQHAPVHAQAHAHARAPGDVGAVIAAAQRAPASLGHQGGHGVIGDAHRAQRLGKRGLQRHLRPVIANAARRARQAAADVGIDHFDAPVHAHKRAA